MITNIQLKRTKASDLRSQLKQVISFCFIYLLATGTVFSQENPWESKPKGENPWATEETVETPEEKTTTPVITGKESTVIIERQTTETNSTSDVAAKSTSTQRYFKTLDGELSLNTKSYKYLNTLKAYGKSIHKANGSLAGGIITGSIVNVFALPVNVIAAAVPTGQINDKIAQFQKDNPHATAAEVSAVRKGITKSRMQKAVIGNIIGIGINIGIFIVLIIS